MATVIGFEDAMGSLFATLGQIITSHFLEYMFSIYSFSLAFSIIIMIPIMYKEYK